MKGEILEDTQCEACGSWEFNCRDEQLFCIACQTPVKESEIKKAQSGEKSPEAEKA